MIISASRSIVERRALGGLRFVDAATGEMITAPLNLSNDVLGFQRNRSGLYAMISVKATNTSNAALAAHLDAFETAPTDTAPGSLTFPITVEDPYGIYLPRIIEVNLPRGSAGTTPIDVELYPAPKAPIGANWSGIRTTLRDASDDPIAGARVTLLRDSDSGELGRGYTDQRGEALVLAVGIPVIDFSATATHSTIVGAKVVTARIEIHSGPGQAWPPNPDAIQSSGQAWVPTIGTLPKPELSTGRILTDGLALSLQPQP